MRVAILGAGAVAFGAAAYLVHAGHDPIIWSPSMKRTVELAAGQPLIATGAICGTFSPRVASSCAHAVENAEIILITLPGYGHKFAFEAVAPHIRDGQPVVISSHMSFGALYLSKLLAARGVSTSIIAWGTTLSTGRQISATEVAVGSVRPKIDLATLPDSAITDGHLLCTALFGNRFERRDGILAIALSNLNPQIHLGIALLNLTRMEHGEEWSQRGNITPAVGRLIEALDRERLAIAEAFDLPVKTVQEHLSLSYRMPPSGVSEMCQEMHRQGKGGSGPKTMDSRYVLEDVPFGLLPTAIMGQISAVKAGLHEAGIAMFSAAYGLNLVERNDLLPELSLQKMSIENLKQLARFGYRSL